MNRLLLCASAGAAALVAGAAHAAVVTTGNVSPSGATLAIDPNLDGTGDIFIGFGAAGGTLEVNATAAPNAVTSIINIDDVLIGLDGGPSGLLKIVGNGTAGSASVEVDGFVTVGQGRDAVVEISAGGQLSVGATGSNSSSYVIVGQQGAGGIVGNSTITIDGAGSVLKTQRIEIGREGPATNSITVSDGGKLDARVDPAATGFDRFEGLIFVGSSSEATNDTLTVTGAGSTVEFSSSLGVTSNGVGKLDVADGGQIVQTELAGAIDAFLALIGQTRFNSLYIQSATGAAEARIAGSDGVNASKVDLTRGVQVGASANVLGASGSLIVEDGGVLETGADGVYVSADGATGSGVLTVSSGGEVIADVTVFDGGVLNGDGGTITGNVTIDGGTLSPGESPGTMIIDGNLEFMNLADILEIEIGGLAAGEFDVIEVLGDLIAPNGFTLELSFLNGFKPQVGDELAFLQIAGDTLVDLAMLNVIVKGLPDGFDFVFNAIDGVLAFATTAAPASEVPIPGAIPLFLSGAAGLAWMRRRRKNA